MSMGAFFRLAACCVCVLHCFEALHAAVYYVDPVKGDDRAAGGEQSPWQSFAPLNERTLGAGDEVIVSPGELAVSLAPKGEGTAENPVRITFRSGEYQWLPKGLVHRRLAISNTNDRPKEEKAIAMELVKLRHFRICGAGALFICRGKMVQIHAEECEHLAFSGFAYDYARPSVSEYIAAEVTDTYTDFIIHPDSRYEVSDGCLIWLGEGWAMPTDTGWVQTVAPDRSFAVRGGPSLKKCRIEELCKGRIRAHYEKNPGFRVGETYQYRAFTRDCAGVFCDRSSDVLYEDVRFCFMHGMGVVSQFSRNLTFRRLCVAPRAESGRTSAAWADILHFSGCSGQILVDDCELTSANDDAINMHGTHLRLVTKQDARHIAVRFMHGQTFGFPAFRAGDRVQYTADDTLLSLGEGRVAEAALSDDGRVMHLTMEEPLPEAVQPGHVVLENLTAIPDITVRNTRVRAITTRGFLFTGRGRIRVENCFFDRTGMPALLMEDDANYWYESGPVHDMQVRGCTFERCAEPVICFNPQVSNYQAPVHRNVRIEDNTFRLKKGCALGLKAVSDVLFRGNRIERAPQGGTPLYSMENAENIRLED